MASAGFLDLAREDLAAKSLLPLREKVAAQRPDEG
jgi:hypothetical protein